MARTGTKEEFVERYETLTEVINSLKTLDASLRKVAPVVTVQDDLDVDAAIQIVDAWLGILEDDYIRDDFEEGAKTPNGDPTIHWVTTEVLRRVQFSVQELTKISETVEGLTSASAYLAQLTTELGAVLKTASGFGKNGQRGAIHSRKLSEAAGVVRSVESQNKLRKIEATAKKALDSTQASATKASAAAGVTGDSAMATHYEAMATRETLSAIRFRLWTILTSMLAGGTALVFLVGPSWGLESLKVETGDYVHLIQRIVVTAAVFGLAAYLARQAHQHRSLANWAGTLAVQLKTFEAFVDPITTDTVKDSIRRSFAERAFGEHPSMKGEAVSQSETATAEKAIDLVTRNLGK
ncbi:hypothetical protein AB4Y77_10565 [Paenarthrobacter sp. YAF11_1]|uniref:hypothetical protein n=1 Tax=Paenarthrobacter sp. YAF11_1 TaxID=3233074 RepID=UPI003F99FDC6